MTKLVIASGNQGKLKEFNRLLAPLNFDVHAQSEFNVPDIEETGLTFIENAILKARNAAKHTGFAALSDDSGLAIDALNGQPGIYSARFSGQGATDSANIQKALNALEGIPGQARTASFHCVLVYLRSFDDPIPVVCHGTWQGTITTQMHGDGGFGYDPIFWVPSHQCTAAQLPPEIKNQLSHRASALKELIKALQAKANFQAK